MFDLKQSLKVKTHSFYPVCACMTGCLFGSFLCYSYLNEFTDSLILADILAFSFLLLITFLDTPKTVANRLNTTFITLSRLKKLIKLDKLTSSSECRAPLYLGEGYEFTSLHTRKITELLDGNLEPLKGKGHGSGQLHNLERKKENIFLSDKDLTGHTIIFGTTGAGKTRFFDLLITQAIMKNDVVIIIDPKGDHDLKEAAFKACSLYKGKDKFRYLDLISKEHSNCSLNPLSSSVSATQIADRIISMSDSFGADSFTRFAQEAITAAVIAIRFKNEVISLGNIRKNMSIESFIEACMFRFEELINQRGLANFRNYFLNCKKFYKELSAEEKRYVKTLENEKEKEEQDTKKKTGRKTVKKIGASEFSSMLRRCYESLTQYYSIKADPDFMFLLKEATISEEYFKKTTATLNPMLNSLTLSEKETILSGDADALTISQIYHEDLVFYCSLRALKDSSSSSFLGKLLLSDLGSFASDVYSGDVTAGKYNRPKRVSIFVDEVSEVANEALVQLLNKSRGANFALTLATQTFSDLSKRTGSKDAANQIVGNCNNLISLRLKDMETAAPVVSALPEVSVPVKSVSNSFSFSGQSGQSNFSIRMTKSPLFPASALIMLPDFEYVAKLADGSFYKGIIPLIRS